MFEKDLNKRKDAGDGLLKKEIHKRPRLKNRLICRRLHPAKMQRPCKSSRNNIFTSAGTVVVVKWSACSPSTLTIQVRIPLKTKVFLNLCLKRTKKNKREAGLARFLTISSLRFSKSGTFWYILTMLLPINKLLYQNLPMMGFEPLTT